MQIDEIKINFFGRSIADVYRAIDGKSLMGAHILIFCLIDYLAYLREGEKQYAYNRFVDDYLTKLNPLYNGLEIYALRCALIHTYGLSNAMKKAGLTGYQFVHKNSKLHLKNDAGDLFINLADFLFDVVKSAWQFFDDVFKLDAGNKTEVAERGRELLKVFGPDGNPVYHASYAEMHSCLAPLDDNGPDMWDKVKQETLKLCASK